MVANKAIPKITLVRLERDELPEFMKIFEEAAARGELGNVLPPKSLAELLEIYDKHKPDYFLVKNAEKLEGIKTGEVVGVGAAYADKKQKTGLIFNQFVMAKFRKKGFGIVRGLENHLIRNGMTRINANIRWNYWKQLRRAFRSGYRPLLWPTLRLFGGKLHFKLSKKIRG